MKRPKGFRDEPLPPLPQAPVEPVEVGEPKEPIGPVERVEPIESTGAEDLPTVDLSDIRVSPELPASTDGQGESHDAGAARTARDRVRDARRQVREARRQRRRKEREERRRFTEFSRKRRRRTLIVLTAISILAAFVGVGLFTPVMSVRDIDVIGVSRVSEDEIVASLEALSGEPLALVRDDDIYLALEQFSLIERYAVEKIPPSTLRIVITEREPILATVVGEEFTLLDPSGVSIETVGADALPEVIPVFRDAPSDPQSPVFRAVSTALRNMPDDLKRMINEISAETPQQITLLLKTGVRVVWGDAADTTRKSIVFTSMLEALGDRPVSLIDVSAPGAPVYVP